MKRELPASGLSLLPPPFNKLPDFDQTLIRQSGLLRHVKKGEVISRPGDKSNYAYYLQMGWCSVSIEGHVTELLAPTSVFMSSLTMHTPCWADVIALSKTTLLCFELRTLREVLERNPELAMRFIETTLQRVARAHVFYALKGSQPVEQRIADILWHVSTPTDEGTRIVPVSLTQAVLASLLGTTREEVNRKRQMLIKTGYLYEEGEHWYMDAMTPMLLSNMPASLTGRKLLR